MDLERERGREQCLLGLTDLVFVAAERSVLLGLLEFGRRQLDGLGEAVVTGLLVTLAMAFFWWSTNRAMRLAMAAGGESRFAQLSGAILGALLALGLQFAMLTLVGEAEAFL